MQTKRLYVGVNAGYMEVFRANATPTEQTHGAKYAACIGPFKTRRAADMCATRKHGPSIQTVSEFEHAAKLRAAGRY